MAEFQNQSLLFGIAGLDLKRTLDLIDAQKAARLTNVRRVEDGALTGRPGTFAVDTGHLTQGQPVHSLTRLVLQAGESGTAFLVVGQGQDLYWGLEGSIAGVSFGTFTGAPLSLVPARPPQSGESYVYVGDRGAMKKIQVTTGTVTPVSPVIDPAHLAADISNVGTPYMKMVDDFTAAGWVDNTGSGGGPSNNLSPLTPTGVPGVTVQFNCNPGGAPAAGYYNYWGKAISVNLSEFAAVGPDPAKLVEDDDLFHLWIRTDHPERIKEFRIYFVLNSAPDLTVVPGSHPTQNTEAYFKTFRPTDFTGLYEVAQDSTVAAAATNTTLQALGQLPSVQDTRVGTREIRGQFNPAQRISQELGAGRGTWLELGMIGVPLRRGDFGRIGGDVTKTWTDVRAVILLAWVNTNQTAAIWLDDFFLYGGFGADTSAVGLDPYDFRYTNFDPRTGDESNPSPEMAPGGPEPPFPPILRSARNVARGRLVVQPDAYGDAAIRQKFYRRGGSLKNNWYYEGMNDGDGNPFVSSASDLSLQDAQTLDIDNDGPVTTVDDAGNTVRNQPLPALWGPVNDIMLGCGDFYRPGFLYWSKPGKYGAWPPTYNLEVCPPTEELMHGFVSAGQPYTFSRERLFSVVPDFSNAAVMNVVPTQCKKGLIARHAFTVVPGGVVFASKDGIEFSPGPGGPAQNLSDDTIYHLFHGLDEFTVKQAKNGYYPIDFSDEALDFIRFGFHENELWFLYRDVNLKHNAMIYNWATQSWRHADFANDVEGIGDYAPSVLFSDWTKQTDQRGSRLLMGTVGTGDITQLATWGLNYTFDGTLPMPTSIIRTGALDQGLPRINKLYGDAFVDIDLKDNSVVVTPYINNEASALPALTITPGPSGRRRYYVPIDSVLARNLSLDIRWDLLPQSDQVHPIIYQGGLSYIPQPDTTEYRVTDWDEQGRLSDKWVKGILIECDTSNVEKTLYVQADGVTKQTIKVKADGRQVLQFSFPQFQGRILRLRPADNVQWMRYDHRWIFDEEPLALLRWESQELTHGLVGWQVPLYAQISLRSTQVVALTLKSLNQDGHWTEKVYDIPSTGGFKQLKFVPFEATKGTQFKYLFNGGATPFWLYREESEVLVQPWSGGSAIAVKPFGNDDLDLVRNMVDAGASAIRSGLANR